MRKKVLIVIGFLALFFVLTNPTISDFEHYLGPGEEKVYKTHNFILWSTYTRTYTSDSWRNYTVDTYIGVAKIFFKVSQEKKVYKMNNRKL